MIVSVVAFLLTLSLVSSLAAWSADEALRRLAFPARWLWLLAMASGPALLFGPALLPDRGDSLARPLPIGVVELPALVVGGGGGGLDPNLLIGALWLAASVTMVGLLAYTHRSLGRERGRWERRDVLGRSVYVSEDRGPAIAGLVHPFIVLPRWALGLPERELGYVLLHEEEHLRAGDAALLTSALCLVVLTPWNPVTWWQLRRLRTAMEVDCDRRVLERAPDRRSYGESLLSVAARASGPALGLPAFSERSHSLERRILTMTSIRSPWTPVRAGVFLVLALVVAAQACGVETPVGSEEGTEAEAVQVAPSILERPELLDGPTFTPFTVAPSIRNRQEVLDAMNAEYPPLLRDAGVGGTVVVWFFIDELGQVQEERISRSSGHRALDEAALAVARVYRFSAAMNRDEAVPAWVQFPITFQPE